jgi:hypothetical protein
MGTVLAARLEWSRNKRHAGTNARTLKHRSCASLVPRPPNSDSQSDFQLHRGLILSLFNARGPDGLVDGKAPGQRSKLSDDHRRALAAMVEAGPIPAIHGVVRWRLVDLAQWIFEEYRISVTKQILSREQRVMGYRKLSARPRHHAQDEAAAAP